MKSVLLIEDDPFISDIYMDALKQAGYRVRVANDGQMGWEKITNEYPDIVLLDINVPKINGWELLRMARRDPRTKNLKVIVITNFGREEFPEDADDLGVRKFFLKVQTTPEEIKQGIKDALN